MPVTYNSYLKIDSLLNQQVPLSDGPEHDELLFIVIHQVYELWFKQILHETDSLITHLMKPDRVVAVHNMSRVRTILKTLVSQIDILETMTPLSFASFRDRLDSASGFQSVQFREMELSFGHKSEKYLERYEEGSPDHETVKRRYEGPSVMDAFIIFLSKSGYAVPQDLIDRDVRIKYEPHEGLQDLLVDLYRNVPEMAEVCERMVDVDEGFQEWRYRHVKMVERTIGTKSGTGGSDGAKYLWSTIRRSYFPDLWAIRSRF